MTHVFSDEEYQEYLTLKNTAEEQKRWIDNIKENARHYIQRKERVCWHEEKYRGYCDECPLGWIFPECPFGREMSFSK
jgi:hypothetical protein